MSRYVGRYWGWPTRIAPRAAQNRDLTASEVESGPEVQRAAERLSAPTGRLTWIVHRPSGAKTVHPTEAAAKLRAAESDGAVWYAAVVEERETA